MLLTELRGAHAGKTCCIVGMGPSLLNLTERDFSEDDVILALNHAIIHIEKLELSIPIYSMQKDGFCVRPKRHPLIVHELEGVHEIGAPQANSPDYSPRYVFNNPADFGLEWYRPSVVTGVKVAELFGCPKVRLLACDALSNGDCRRVDYDAEGHVTMLPPFPAYTAPTDKLRELERTIPIVIDWNRPTLPWGPAELY
jgi:hypothetical protein